MGFVPASCSVVSLPSAACAAASSSTPRILPLISVRWSAGRRRKHRSLLGLQLAEVTGRAHMVGMAAAVLSSSKGATEKEASRLRPFLSVSSEDELLSRIRMEEEAGRLTPKLASGMEDLYNNYRNAVLQSRIPQAKEVILSNMSVCLDRIMLDIEDPYIFPPHHKAVREPFDYYMFGQNYIRPLVDFRESYVGNLSFFNEIEEKIRKGHNVVLFSNHQTEADPAIISLLLERTHPLIAEEMICIAGDRVVTDPLCKPFSMGRNLICVYSKKHMYDNPELVEMKRRANTKSLKELALLLRTGGHIIWIAPSGGRDRPDPQTGEWYPEPFDVSSVDNMRRLTENSNVTGHMYTLALLCYDIMPPPRQIEKQIGERRKISFHGVGLSVGPEINFEKTAADFKCFEEVISYQPQKKILAAVFHCAYCLFIRKLRKRIPHIIMIQIRMAVQMKILIIDNVVDPDMVGTEA